MTNDTRQAHHSTHPDAETVKEDAPKGCGCIRLTNEALQTAYPGVRVVEGISYGCTVVAVYRQSGKGKKLPILFATFCPFCGVKYPD